MMDDFYKTQLIYITNTKRARLILAVFVIIYRNNEAKAVFLQKIAKNERKDMQKAFAFY